MDIPDGLGAAGGGIDASADGPDCADMAALCAANNCASLAWSLNTLRSNTNSAK